MTFLAGVCSVEVLKGPKILSGDLRMTLSGGEGSLWPLATWGQGMSIVTSITAANHECSILRTSWCHFASKTNPEACHLGHQLCQQQECEIPAMDATVHLQERHTITS
eukprot:1159727-Pelagomonas_calceolata.AAC.11